MAEFFNSFLRRGMIRSIAFLLLLLVTPVRTQAQDPSPETTSSAAKRGWINRLLHPFSPSASRIPDYKDPKLRGLTLQIQVSPQPVKLSEIRQLEVKAVLTSKAKTPVALDFPTDQRVEIYLMTSEGTLLTKWSDNHAINQKSGTLMINPQEHVEYNERIATRDLTPNKVFIVEVFFPKYPELRARQKFLTAP
jgi:Intracellular proteinase inhibitor